MSATTSRLPKDQPWKAHWSPVKNAAGIAGEKYLVSESGTLLIDGDASGASPDLLSELACARKEPNQTKAQPWKTHWSPVNNVAGMGGEKYLVSESGTLLIDGLQESGSPDLFSELACASKEGGKNGGTDGGLL